MHDDGDRRERRRRRRRIQDIQLLLVGTALAVSAAAVAGRAAQDRQQPGDLKIVLDDRSRLPGRFYGRYTASLAAGLLRTR